MADGLSAIADGIAALFELAWRVLVSAFTFVAYACSGAYRRRKNTEWTGRPVRKFLELGFSGLCLAALISLGVWGLLALTGGKSGETARRTGGADPQGRIRFSLQVTDAAGTNYSLNLALDKQGVHKIVAAEDLNDLANGVKENVKTIQVRTSATPNRLVSFEFSLTNQ